MLLKEYVYLWNFTDRSYTFTWGSYHNTSPTCINCGENNDQENVCPHCYYLLSVLFARNLLTVCNDNSKRTLFSLHFNCLNKKFFTFVKHRQKILRKKSNWNGISKLIFERILFTQNYLQMCFFGMQRFFFKFFTTSTHKQFLLIWKNSVRVPKKSKRHSG